MVISMPALFSRFFVAAFLLPSNFLGGQKIFAKTMNLLDSRWWVIYDSVVRWDGFCRISERGKTALGEQGRQTWRSRDRRVLGSSQMSKQAGKPDTAKVARPVWSGGKVCKALPIGRRHFPTPIPHDVLERETNPFSNRRFLCSCRSPLNDGKRKA